MGHNDLCVSPKHTAIIKRFKFNFHLHEKNIQSTSLEI